MNQQTDDLRLKCLDQTIPKEWLDRNGHMNMQYYFGLVDRALAGLESGSPGGDGGLRLPRVSLRASRIHYRKELFAGQEVEVFVQPLMLRGPEIELSFEIMTAGPEPLISAECTVAGVLADPHSGEPVAPAADVAREWERRLAPPTEPAAIPPSFELPFREDHWFVAAEGVVPASVLNDRGEVALMGHTHLFERGGMGMFAELNRAENVFVPGSVGGFALGTRTEYHARIRAGGKFRVRSRVCAVGRKTVSFRHELFLLDETPVVAAACDHTMIFIDMTRRRSMPVPDLFKQILGRRYGVVIA